MNVALNGIKDKTGFYEKIRRFNLYYLAFVSFFVAYGRVLKLDWISLGKHPENSLPIPILLSLYLAFTEKGYKWPITYREKVFLFYAIFISLMPFWGLYLDQSLGALKEFWAAAAFSILIMYNAREEEDLRLLVFAFLSGSLLRGFVSIFEYFKGAKAITGSFSHYNVYGNFLLVPLSFLIGLLLYDSKKQKNKIFLFVVFSLLAFTLLTTMSRAPIVALLLSFILFAILVNRKALILALLLPLVIGAFIYSNPDSVISKRVLSVKWEDGSLQSRIQYIWPVSIAIYKDHNIVLGIGSGSYHRVFKENLKYKSLFKGNPYAHNHPHAHNDFLQALVTQGAIGAFIYIFFISQMIYLSWMAFKSSTSPLGKAIGCAGFIWIIGHALAGIVHHEYHQSRYNMSVGFMISAIILTQYMNTERKT